jgi:tetratricopeptide (TPR) repeat protein
VAELSPQSLTALGSALHRSGANAASLVKAAQERHPADFWLNFLLGNVLARTKPEDAAGYYRAALAVRPDTSAVYNNLGTALKEKGQLGEAVKAYRKAIRNPLALPYQCRRVTASPCRRLRARYNEDGPAHRQAGPPRFGKVPAPVWSLP